VKRSRKAAILQLKIGRLAHVIGIASGLALALTAVIAYGLENWSVLSNAPEFLTTLKWVIPLVAGVLVALVALAFKWEPYLTDRREAHFMMTIAAIVVPALFIVLIALDEMGSISLGRPDWLYAASLLGISLTEISLAMTWEGTSRRRTISIVSAIFPPVLLLFPIIFNFTSLELASILPMAYLGSAVAFQLSGSMLHIIASSTSVQQREVLRASDSKLKEQLIEFEKKRHALIYREDALRSKESDLEAYETRLQQDLAVIEDKRAQVSASEADIEMRLQQAKEERLKLSRQAAELDSKLDTIGLRQVDADARKGELERLAKSLSTKEAALAARERDANRLLAEGQAKDRDLKDRLAEAEAEEVAVGVVRKELQEFEASLTEREKAVIGRETQLDLKALEVTLSKEQLSGVSADKNALRQLEEQMLMKQAALAEKEISLRAAEDELKKKSERAERLISRSDKQMNELIEKEASIATKEKDFAQKEADLKAAVESLNFQLEDVEKTKASFSDREKQYQDLSVTTRTKLTSVESREEEIARKMSALEKREQKIKELDQGLTAERERMNAKLRELLEKEKDLQAEEAEVGLKQAELKAMEREMLESVDEVEEARAEIPEEEDEQAKTLEFREKRLMEREQEMKSRLYQREKDLEKREQSLRVHLAKDIEEMGEAVEEEYTGEKVKTGIERLDDLLMGGMPFGSNVLYIGPPFIGKEVAMLLFIAEGLRKGVPAVIVTTSHPPAEIAKEMAPILPTFLEFQQLGLVQWIDASGVPGQEDTGEDDSGAVHVAGPGDYDGILSAIDKCAKGFQKQKHQYFRLAFLSLSMSLTQSTDEKAAFQFVQTVAAKVKQAQSVSLYALERGMHTEQQLESIQHLMTGAVQFKTDKQKTLISVQGVGDVQTRDWIEYKHTNKAVMIGAFSLERIR